MSEPKIGLLYVCGIMAAVTLCATIRTILPFVKAEEYYEVTQRIDRNIKYTVIHDNASCPMCSTPWLKRKYPKYNILIKEDATFCSECFHPDEVQKLIVTHRLNLSELYKRYSIQGTESQAKQHLQEYNTNPDINEIYW